MWVVLAALSWPMANATHAQSAAAYMDCGAAPLCGVLVLETGLGPGAYQHVEPGVHGLWPETDEYGSSRCVAPVSSAEPSKLSSCYNRSDEADPLGFERHEWDKHGKCAGVRDSDDYFTQLCALAVQPLSVMTQTRQAGHSNLSGYGKALTAAGYAVFSLDETYSQVFLSACAGDDGRWILADVASFSNECRGASPGPSPTPSGRCLPDQHGPPCKVDANCTAAENCVRCAHSGYCTDVPS